MVGKGVVHCVPCCALAQTALPAHITFSTTVQQRHAQNAIFLRFAAKTAWPGGAVWHREKAMSPLKFIQKQIFFPKIDLPSKFFEDCMRRQWRALLCAHGNSRCFQHMLQCMANQGWAWPETTRGWQLQEIHQK